MLKKWFDTQNCAQRQKAQKSAIFTAYPQSESAELRESVEKPRGAQKSPPAKPAGCTPRN
jgi:hypothetical protein